MHLCPRGLRAAARSLATRPAEGKISVLELIVVAAAPLPTKLGEVTFANASRSGTPQAHADSCSPPASSGVVVTEPTCFRVGRSAWRRLIAVATARACLC